MADIIQLRRDTAANWTTVNPILAQGEAGLETDTQKIKVGNGSSTWTALSYWSLGTSGYVSASAAVFTGSIDEQVYTVSGTTPALDPSNGTIQVWTLTGASSPTDSILAGEYITLMIDDGSAFAITWPTMTWVNNKKVAPTLAATGYTVVSLWKVGTTLYGALVGDGA